MPLRVLPKPMIKTVTNQKGLNRVSWQKFYQGLAFMRPRRLSLTIVLSLKGNTMIEEFNWSYRSYIGAGFLWQEVLLGPLELISEGEVK